MKIYHLSYCEILRISENSSQTDSLTTWRFTSICDGAGKSGCAEVGEIPPGGGVSVVAYDTDTITAALADSSQEVEQFRVDIAGGIVQDWAIGLRSPATSPHTIAAAPAQKGASTRAPTAEQAKWRRGDPKPGSSKKQETKEKVEEEDKEEDREDKEDEPAAVRVAKSEPKPPRDDKSVVKCPPGEVRIARDMCEKKSSQSIAQTSGSVLKSPHHVPMYLKSAGSRLKKIMPWLKNYILEREEEWKQLPRGQGAFDESDPTVSARSTAYNLLSSGRSVIEKAKLKILRDAIGAAGAPHAHLLACHSFSHTSLRSPCAEQWLNTCTSGLRPGFRLLHLQRQRRTAQV